MKKIYLQMIVIFLFFVRLNTLTYSQTLNSKIDSLLEEKYKPNDPGAVFLISKKGKIIYQKAFGLADIEINSSMKVESVFEIGSITKQFTAMAILMLYEQGKLKLDDEITKFIPDYPTNGNKITIHHLLTHTSGICSFTDMKSINEISKKDLTPVELIDFFKNEPMDFKPGEQFKYNNSGYVILGYIIELLTGKSYGDYIEQNIFQKIGMESSICASHKKIIKNRASGYQDKNGYINCTYISFTIPYSSGSLMSNAEDMFKWQQAIRNNLLISKQTTEKIFKNYNLNNVEKINYGYAWHIKEINGVPTNEHGGSIFGFKSMSVYIPSEDIYVIGLTNCDCNSPTQVTRQIAELALMMN
ncbi:MAG: beta-lactamase family protein [Ignavibacteriae bacterium]|nr:beta-lactamase family protein [Ignavibacteriota bacterium]